MSTTTTANTNTNTNTIYLVTGANRGIGRGLVDVILSRPNTTVIALVRDVEHETTRSLVSTTADANVPTPKTLDPSHPDPDSNPNTNHVIIIPYDASIPGSAETALTTLGSTHGITHVDTVIANAGMLTKRGPSIDTAPSDIQESVQVNAIAPLDLFRACLTLLSPPPSKFVAVSSAIGSTQLIPQHSHSSTLAYGVSKAALNHIMRKLSIEYPDMVVEVVTPGPVLTDLLRENKPEFDAMLKANPQLLERFVPIDKVCNGLMALIDSASSETSGGFRDWSGEVIPF
ncbi:hypothetical protein PV08_07394 [Exophiala spinifera]|uniref:Ketoreductase (KR) domain-containing protein n=1 Tax=Exophiala spinifera TaxID=91928 RepID=A0A0D2B7G2_9EURO|nr:uncharacterized protein PV08_07394 [Exophiala spinifera]KIW14610.1 hypothetical protein PV08_07394 [Exophiala spinifera]